MIRNDKLSKYMLGFILLLFIGGLLALNTGTPARKFSESENRLLEQQPSFSLKNVINGTFTANFEKYLSDQFAFRDFWIGVKSEADRMMGKKESNGVYLGKDGFLIQKFGKPEDGDLEKKGEAINGFVKVLPGLRTYLLLAPTAASVLEEKLPAHVTGDDERMYLEKVKEAVSKDVVFVDVYPAMRARKEEYLYYKTDHHWTTRGAYYAYRELGKQMGFTPRDEADFRIEKGTDEFYGSLYSKSGFRHVLPDRIDLYVPKDAETYRVEYAEEKKSSDSLYERDNLQKKDKYTVFLNGNHPLIKIASGSREGKKLVVVKDSYANCFLPFLTAHFDEIYVVDLRYYEDRLDALIRENHITDMLLLYNVNTFFEEPSIKELASQS
ncbi:DHHW family protein [Brevibacillus borstelensis]|uniref:DHHW family protein n=1 Tax=Brevibacillus borstelensis TaxID=45462 RepID=UPI0030C2B2A2